MGPVLNMLLTNRKQGDRKEGSLKRENPHQLMLMRVPAVLVALHGFEPRTCGL
jgi:hypothetical protein